MRVITKIVSILLFGLFLFSACSNLEESQTEKSNDSLDNHETTDNKDNDASTIDEEDIPMSEMNFSEISLNSVFFKSSIDIDSSFEKEVMETLSEFNAVETEDGTKLTLPENILFDFDSADLRSEAGNAIDQLVQLIDTTDDEVTIVGYTDSKGEDSYNQKLSEDRANAVLNALANESVKKNRIIAEGKGSTEPIAENTKQDGSDNPDGRQKNRRVEVTIQGFNK